MSTASRASVLKGRALLLLVFLLPAVAAVFWQAPRPRILSTWNAGAEVDLNCFSPDNKLLATTNTRPPHTARPVCVWDVETGRKRYAHLADCPWRSHVAFSPDGRFLTINNEGEHLKLCQAASGEEYADIQLL